MRPRAHPTNPHFSYRRGRAATAHNKGGESLAHSLAKLEFGGHRKLRLTEYQSEYIFELGGLQLERPFTGPISKEALRVDIEAELLHSPPRIRGAKSLYIEIKIGNPVKDAKRAELRCLHQPAIEIRLPVDLAKYKINTITANEFITLRKRLKGLLNPEKTSYGRWLFPPTPKDITLDLAPNTPAPAEQKTYSTGIVNTESQPDPFEGNFESSAETTISDRGMPTTRAPAADIGAYQAPALINLPDTHPIIDKPTTIIIQAPTAVNLTELNIRPCPRGLVSRMMAWIKSFITA